jgi:hypothetical protein
MGAQHSYGGANCFSGIDDGVALLPDFVKSIEYISEKQRSHEIVSLSFTALRTTLTNFARARLKRTPTGWSIDGPALVAGRREMKIVGEGSHWRKTGVDYVQVPECADVAFI